MPPISASNSNNANYDCVVLYPADSTFDEEENVNTKGREWKISDVLQSSQQHAHVGSTVIEANVIPRLAYLQVGADSDTGGLKLRHSYVFKEPKASDTHELFDTLGMTDEAGCQFLPGRGCVIIRNELLGYVVVLPIAMVQFFSVKLAWEPKQGGKYPIHPNVRIEKGGEISNFEFGGSDIVLVFREDAEIQILEAQSIDATSKITSKQK